MGIISMRLFCIEGRLIPVFILKFGGPLAEISGAAPQSACGHSAQTNCGL